MVPLKNKIIQFSMGMTKKHDKKTLYSDLIVSCFPNKYNL